MSNPNLHPVWAKVLGVTPQTSPSTTAPSSAPVPASPLAEAIAVMTGHSSGPHHGWQATNRPRSPGAPVGIKKQVGPGVWVSTVARPGDTHYPVHP